MTEFVKPANSNGRFKLLNWGQVGGAIIAAAAIGSFASWRASERNNIVLNNFVVPNLMPKGELLIQIGQLNKDIAENKLKIREIELSMEKLKIGK